MDEQLKRVLEQFKSRLKTRLRVHDVVLFGSRARGDADAESDVDVVVILEGEATEADREYVSECAWEIGFANRLLLSTISFSREEWEHGPEKNSLLGQSVRSDGISI